MIKNIKVYCKYTCIKTDISWCLIALKNFSAFVLAYCSVEDSRQADACSLFLPLHLSNWALSVAGLDGHAELGLQFGQSLLSVGVFSRRVNDRQRRRDGGGIRNWERLFTSTTEFRLKTKMLMFGAFSIYTSGFACVASALISVRALAANDVIVAGIGWKWCHSLLLCEIQFIALVAPV